MAFSDAFARGYQIGDAARKRRAAAKYFEKMKELTDEPIEADEVAGLDIPDSEVPAFKGDGDVAIPASRPVAAVAGIPEAEAVTPPAEEPETAIPLYESGTETISNARATPREQLEAPALPLSEEAAAPIKIKAPKKLLDNSKRNASLTQANIKELDRLAMEAARASGDVEVYNALQRTTDSFLQAKVLRYMGQAQTAATENDVDAVEAALKKAYRFVPDGREPNFTRVDGKLMAPDPWGKDGEMVELDANMIGNLTTMLRDPEKWAEIMREEGRHRRTEAREDKRLELEDERVKQFARSLGIQEGELDIKRDQAKLEALMAPVDRMARYQQGIYYGALAAEAKKSGKNVGDFLTEMDATSRAIQTSMEGLITPPINKVTGEADPAWKPSDSVLVGVGANQRPLSRAEMDEAMGHAQTIAVSNRGLVGYKVAELAGLQIQKALVDPQNFNANIDPKTGQLLVRVGGGVDPQGNPTKPKFIPVQIPPELAQALTQRAQSPAPTDSFWSSGQYSQ